MMMMIIIINNGAIVFYRDWMRSKQKMSRLSLYSKGVKYKDNEAKYRNRISHPCP